MVECLLNCDKLNKRSTNSLGQNAIHVAVLGGDLDMLKLVTSPRVSIAQEADNRGMWPIHIAVLSNNFAALKYLMEEIPGDGEYKKPNLTQNEDFTPVLYACHKGNREILQYLIDNGGDISAKSKKGVTALHLSCGAGMLEMTEYLIQVHQQDF